MYSGGYPNNAVATGDNGLLAQDRPSLGLRCTVRTRHKAVDLALAYCDRCVIGAAKPGGRFDYCVQHRLDIRGRAADNLQHVAGRGLVLERFLEIARAGVQFVEQADILDRDDGLVGEGLKQVDLPLRKRLDLAARYGDCADRIAVLQDRHREHGAHPRLQDGPQRIFGVRGSIGNVRDFPSQNGARRRALPAGRDRKVTLDGLEDIGRPPVMRDKMDQRSIEPENAACLSAR